MHIVSLAVCGNTAMKVLSIPGRHADLDFAGIQRSCIAENATTGQQCH
jgi:hypothetical protein